MHLLPSVVASRRKMLAAAAALALAGGVATFGAAESANADPCPSIFGCVPVEVAKEVVPPTCICPWERYSYADAIRVDAASRFDAVLLNPQPLPPRELGRGLLGG